MPRIRAVISREEDWWCAQCLEYDIAVQARNRAELRDALVSVLSAHFTASAELGQPAFAGLPAAPKRFFREYAAQAGSPEKQLVKPIDLQAKLRLTVAAEVLPVVVARTP